MARFFINRPIVAIVISIVMVILGVVSLVQRGAASMGRINRIFEEHPAITDPAEPHELPPAHGGREVAFEHVWFKYPSAGDRGWVLEDVSFSATELEDKQVQVDAAFVRGRLATLVKDEDLSRYIL